MKPIAFAGGHVTGRSLVYRNKTVALTPREVELAEVLARSGVGIVTYDTLYSEILGRRFHGDTSNMRVLLGKLRISSRAVGIAFDRWIEVIPKLGYRYAVPASRERASARPVLRKRPAEL